MATDIEPSGPSIHAHQLLDQIAQNIAAVKLITANTAKQVHNPEPWALADTKPPVTVIEKLSYLKAESATLVMFANNLASAVGESLEVEPPSLQAVTAARNVFQR